MPDRARSPTSCSRSSLSVQQMQPFESSTIRSAVCTSFVFLISAASMFRDDMSFTTTHTFMCVVLPRMCFSRVVLPAPRKPDRRVSGSFR